MSPVLCVEFEACQGHPKGAFRRGWDSAGGVLGPDARDGEWCCGLSLGWGGREGTEHAVQVRVEGELAGRPRRSTKGVRVREGRISDLRG